MCTDHAQSRCSFYALYLIIVLWQGDCLPYDDIGPTHSNAWSCDTVFIQLVVARIAHACGVVGGGLGKMGGRRKGRGM